MKREAKQIEVHPAADIFPMMTEEELAALAEDIKANGLIHPIIVDKDGQLIDGRNRHAACKLAGVEPVFEQLNGRDPLAFIASANLQRRNLTKGQQAVALAMIYPEPGQRGRGKKGGAEKSAETTDFSATRLRQARQILAYSQPLAQDILNATISLDEALKKVEAERLQANGNEARMERLRKHAPDLADLVTEERMTLTEATAAWMQRDEERRASYRAGVQAAEHLNDFVSQVAAIIGAEEVRSESEPPIALKPEYLDNVRAALKLLEEFFARSRR